MQGETAIQFYLTQKEDELGSFTLQVIQAKKANKQACLEAKLLEGTIGFSMTPQEELFAKFFANEAVRVKEMDDLTLKAHREELAAIAFEARARLTAVDEEDRERTRKGVKRQGFETEDGDITSDAINTIKERQKRMSKMEKLRKNLEEMGVESADIDKILSARNIRDKVKGEPKGEPTKTNNVTTTFNPFPTKEPKKDDVQGGINWTKVIEQVKEIEPSRPVVLPSFGKSE